MCMCETAFEVTMLGAFCLVYHGLTVASILLTKDSYELDDYIMLVYAGGSAAIALLLLLGARSGNKRYVELFLRFAKIRLLLYCILAGFLALRLIFHGNSSGGGFIHPVMILPHLVARFLAKKATTMELFGIDLNSTTYLIPVVIGILADAFVIYRVQLFCDTKL
ncbi:hypothetical protein MTO96_023002 [Rhipicephalus appendiculatus]